MQVVIDTNIFYDDLMLNGASFRLLLARARKGDFKLALPEVVVLETVGKYRERVQSVVSGLVESSRRLADRTSHQRSDLDLDVDAEPIHSSEWKDHSANLAPNKF